MTSPLAIREVFKRYGDTTVLHSVSFECPRGAIVAFVGPNGAGKSTTLRIACRLSSADSGEVVVSDEEQSVSLRAAS